MSRRDPRYGSRRWKALRLEVFDRDGWRCCDCGKAGRLHCDHVIPIGESGAFWDPQNLQTLCAGCHMAGKTAIEHAKRFRGRPRPPRRPPEPVTAPRPEPPGVAAWDRLVGELARPGGL